MPRSFENERGFLLVANGAVLNTVADDLRLRCAGVESFMCPADRIRVPAGDPDESSPSINTSGCRRNTNGCTVVDFFCVKIWLVRENQVSNSEIRLDVRWRTWNIIQGILVRYMVLN